MNEISLCMIVKNEEKNLNKCLSRIASFMDEIIIVDTGSIDRTKEVAYRFTDKVYDFPWINDFSAARNFSVSKASKDYILYLDSDEFTESIDIDEIKRLISKNPLKVGRVLCINEFTRKGILYRQKERIKRLFAKNYYHFEGIIHEQIVPISEENSNEYEHEEVIDSGEESYASGEGYSLPLTVLHSGYEGNLLTRRKKTERNIRLLKLAYEQKPKDAYIIYQLGKSYYMEEDYVKACEYFGQALSLNLDLRLDYVQDMIESYGYSLINSEQYSTAMQLLNIYDDFAHSADFIFLVALILMNNGRFNEAIKEFQKATRHIEAKIEGVNGYLAYYNIGIIYECLGDMKNAVAFYKECGDYDAAKQRLKGFENNIR